MVQLFKNGKSRKDIIHEYSLTPSALDKCIKGNLHRVSMFHTDRGKEFDNACIEDTLTTFGIQRSLSIKGCTYDNAIAELTFKAVKTEFIYPNCFRTLDELNLQLSDYINWFNHHRVHGSLNYQTSVGYKLNAT